MTNLMTVGGTINFETMTSLQISEVTGKRHADIMRDIRNLLEQVGEEGERIFALSSYRSEQNKDLPMYILNKKGCLFLASGYDAVLRLKIINRWEELELAQQSKLPRTFADALRMLANEVEQKELALAQRDEAIATKAYISDKKTATAMQTASHLSRENKKLRIEVDKSKEYATITTIERATKKRYGWKPLRDYANAHELEMPKVHDKRYGYVRSYPAQAWKAVYGIDITIS